MSLFGELSEYPSGRSRYTYFASGDLSSSKCIAFIGGLGGGVGREVFMGTLSNALKAKGWKLIQFHWTSAYEGFRTSSLERDAVDMEYLTSHLATEGITDLIFMGNSTGCQSIAKLFSTRPSLNPIIKGGILQAPVSDREFLTHSAETKEPLPEHEARGLLEAAAGAPAHIAQGRGEEIDPVLWKLLGERTSYYRIHSLYGKGGGDDYFSSDLPSTPETNTEDHAHPLSTSFGRFALPTLALWSAEDQYAWTGLDKPAERMQRWADACPPEAPLTWAVVEGADHGVTDVAAQHRMIELIMRWMMDIRVVG